MLIQFVSKVIQKLNLRRIKISLDNILYRLWKWDKTVQNYTSERTKKERKYPNTDISRTQNLCAIPCCFDPRTPQMDVPIIPPRA